MTISISFLCRPPSPRRSWFVSLVVWLCAPLLLSVVSAFVFPAFAVLAVLLFCMKVSHDVHVQNCTYVWSLCVMIRVPRPILFSYVCTCTCMSRAIDYDESITPLYVHCIVYNIMYLHYVCTIHNNKLSKCSSHQPHNTCMIEQCMHAYV